jgi:hypothetical protein
MVVNWYEGTLDKDAWLFSPAMTLTAGATYEVSFWLVMPELPGNVNDYLEVQVGTSALPAGMTGENMIYYNTDESIPNWTLISGWFTPTTTGSYYLGFHSFAPVGHWGMNILVDDIMVKEVEKLFDNDLIISDICMYPYTQVPKSQPLYHELAAEVRNVGLTTQTNVIVTVELNGVVAGVSAPLASLEPNTSAVLEINTDPNVLISLGTNTVAFIASQDETEQAPEDNTATLTFTGTENIYAADDGTFINHLLEPNCSLPVFIGNVFEVTYPIKITGVNLRFGAGASMDYSVSLYNAVPIPEYWSYGIDLPTIFTQPATRPAAEGWVTVDVPPTNLAPGTYFLSVDQLTTESINLNSDGQLYRYGFYVPEGITVLRNLNTTDAIIRGVPLIRMVVADSAPCEAEEPTGLQADPSYTSAVLSWTGETPLNFRITLNDGTDEFKYFTADNTYTAEGLASGVTYTWKVAAMCNASEGSSDVAGDPFTTLIGIPGANKREINIFPNPSSGLVYISVAEASNITVYDITGRMIDHFKINAETMVNFTQPAGIYIIRVESGNKISNHRLIIE